MKKTQQLRQHGAVVAVGFDQRLPKGQRGFLTFADGTTHRFEGVREAEAYVRAHAAKGGPVEPSDGEPVPAGEGYCTVSNCTSSAGSPCPKFVPGATATTCNSCGHLKSRHVGKVKPLDFAGILQALT
jgi:hypothetical protein